MTKNQVDYANYLENRRHNQASEKHDVNTLEETRRHNLAGERNAVLSLEESKRHNLAGENISYASLSETVRSNKAREDLTQRQIDTQYQQVVLQTEATRYAAGVSAAATRYAAEQSAAASRYSADQSLAATQYNSDTQRDIAVMQDERRAKDQALTSQRDVMNYNLEQTKLQENLTYQYTSLAIDSSIDAVDTTLRFIGGLAPNARYTIPN